MWFIKSFKNLNKFELTLLICSNLAIILSFIFFKNTNYLTLIASMIGVTSLVFIAKGDVLGPILTIIFSLFYGYISFNFKYYGELITYVGMTTPIDALSIIAWIKNPYSDKEVKVSELNKKKWIFLWIISLIVTISFYFILKALDTRNLVLSTISVLTTFLAVALTLLRNRYYALAYAANDIVLIILWILACKENMMYISLVICFMVFFVNDIYGFINWTRMKNRQEKNI